MQKDDVIYRQDAINTALKCSVIEVTPAHMLIDKTEMVTKLLDLPSAQPERTEYIPDIKAVRSKRDCVDLAERVTTTFYDQEHEEWIQQTATIADVLDSVCDEYTVLPSAQPEQLTDNEKRIFLAAMAREELICSQIDEKHNDPNLLNLVEICHEIMRKVKGALWTR